jgi:hypothetical protein
MPYYSKRSHTFKRSNANHPHPPTYIQRNNQTISNPAVHEDRRPSVGIMHPGIYILQLL